MDTVDRGDSGWVSRRGRPVVLPAVAVSLLSMAIVAVLFVAREPPRTDSSPIAVETAFRPAFPIPLAGDMAILSAPGGEVVGGVVDEDGASERMMVAEDFFQPFGAEVEKPVSRFAGELDRAWR